MYPYPMSFLPAWFPLAGWTAYQLMLATSYVLAFALVMPWATRTHLPRGRVFLALVAVLFGSLVGARWLPWLLAGCPRFDDASSLPLFVHGGLAGGVGALVAAVLLAGLPLVAFMDRLSIPLALGIGLTRIGCFLTGCDYGAPCGAFPLGVRYHAWATPSGPLTAPPALLEHVARAWLPPEAAASLPVHPVQLYESALGLALAAWLWWRAGRNPRPALGSPAASFLLVYGLGRFLLEFLRGDADRGVDVLHSFLSAPQVLSLVLVAAGWAWLARARRRGSP
jgi:phosphatidylglycerol---prolipoprotein diacylglyceryl transferase